MNVLITGGASGLGGAFTRELLRTKEVHKIYITYNNSLDKAKALQQTSSKIEVIRCDFTSKKDIDRLCSKIETIDLDILVNNAITGLEKKHFHKKSSESFIQSFESNIIPIIKITQSSLKVFRKKKFGKIITILTAYLANKPPSGFSEYCASKSYLMALSKSWMVENSRFNITVNNLLPSFMETQLNSEEDKRMLKNLEESLPLKTFLKVEEVAECLKFLVVSSQQINGQNIVINQGVDLL